MKKSNKIIVLIITLILLISSYFTFKLSNKDEKIFNKKIVFYPQHQDDEVLWSGPAIVQAIKERGAQNVYVVLVSNGGGIKLYKYQEFNNLDKQIKIDARLNEFYESLNALGVKESNIFLLNQEDTYEYNDFSKMENAVIKLEKELKDVTHVTHTPIYDWHPQHRKNGEVVYNLYKEGLIKDALFYVRPENEKYIKGKVISIYANSKDDIKKVEDACNQYKLIDVENNRYGIGYTSDHKSFDRLLDNPKSVLHTPDL